MASWRAQAVIRSLDAGVARDQSDAKESARRHAPVAEPVDIQIGRFTQEAGGGLPLPYHFVGVGTRPGRIRTGCAPLVMPGASIATTSHPCAARLRAKESMGEVHLCAVRPWPTRTVGLGPTWSRWRHSRPGTVASSSETSKRYSATSVPPSTSVSMATAAFSERMLRRLPDSLAGTCGHVPTSCDYASTT